MNKSTVHVHGLINQHTYLLLWEDTTPTPGLRRQHQRRCVQRSEDWTRNGLLAMLRCGVEESVAMHANGAEESRLALASLETRRRKQMLARLP
jgi:hypothetical protein